MSIYKYKDVRKKLIRDTKRGPLTRPVSGITHLVIHHSLTKQGLAGSNAEAYARFHVQTNGWRNIAYAYVIEPDGTTKHCLDHNVNGPHVGDHNRYSIGVCLTGDFRSEKPTKEQEKALRALVAHLKKAIPSIKYVRGHSEMPGYAWKPCPVFDYKKVLAGKDSGTSAPVKWDGKSFPGRSAFQMGKSHPAVTLMGKRLVAHGFDKHYKVGPGPTFSEADRKNVQDFQKAQGWTGSDADGFPGPVTWERLMKAPEKPAPKPNPKPAPKPGKGLHRVKVDGKQVGAYREDQNVVDAVKKGMKKNPDKIQIEKVK